MRISLPTTALIRDRHLAGDADLIACRAGAAPEDVLDHHPAPRALAMATSK